MMTHVHAQHAVRDLLCGTCWLPHHDGNRCAAELLRHERTWRRDHAPNPRDYADWATYDAATGAWHQATAELHEFAELLRRTRPAGGPAAP
jgi:hypothetical protein